LIAGHETTSGTLSFMTYELLKSPASYQKLRQEVDSVLGDEHIRYGHFSKLPYLVAVMRETLRLHPPVGVLAVTPFEDTVIGGRYLIKKETVVSVQNGCLHRDPAVWGDDVSLIPFLRVHCTLSVTPTHIIVGRRIQAGKNAGWEV
jgi:cytochrome P450/NADPH-cytochrome P450 reductase